MVAWLNWIAPTNTEFGCVASSRMAYYRYHSIFNASFWLIFAVAMLSDLSFGFRIHEEFGEGFPPQPSLTIISPENGQILDKDNVLVEVYVSDYDFPSMFHGSSICIAMATGNRDISHYVTANIYTKRLSSIKFNLLTVFRWSLYRKMLRSIIRQAEIPFHGSDAWKIICFASCTLW